jgi:surface antigen
MGTIGLLSLFGQWGIAGIAGSRLWRARHVASVILASISIAGCAGTASEPNAIDISPLPPPSDVAIQQYAEMPGPDLQCVPYARDHSGIGIFGDAYRWWTIADGYFMRTSKPALGAVLVLSRTEQLRHGHVAVVSGILGPRQILVDHANWLPGKIITGMPVADVSRGNDWSLLRFWNQGTGKFGAIYPAEGFIFNPSAFAQSELPWRLFFILARPQSVG